VKRIITILLAGLLVCAVVAPCLAWEFEMKGLYENRLRYFGRMGNNDLFGVASYQDAGANTFVGFAGPNIYGTGNRAPVLAGCSTSAGGTTQNPAMVITRGGFSRWGSDAYYNDSRMSLDVTLRLNKAVRLHGIKNIGGIRNKYRQTGPNEFGAGIGVAPLERYYMSQSSMNATDGVFETWEQFRATIQTPWCVFSIGLKDFPMGTGATLGYNTRGESFLSVIPFGPFRLLPGIWLARCRFTESWQTIPDGESKPEFFEACFFTYDQGSVSAGGCVLLRFDHRGRGATPPAAAYGTTTASFNVPLSTQQARDDLFFVGMLFFKYFDGRFFANAEYTWATSDRYYPVAQPLDGANAGGRPQQMLGYHWFSELGTVCGPAKLSLMYGIVSGLVLNYGNARKGCLGLPMNYQAMEPYEWLMFNTYAGGNSGGWLPSDITFVSDEHGAMVDGYCFAGRVDYSVAANLNIWGSYIWAHRLERAGFLNGGFQDAGNGTGGPAPGTLGSAGHLLDAYGGGLGTTTPYCPDGHIGKSAWAWIGSSWKALTSICGTHCGSRAGGSTMRTWQSFPTGR